MIQRLLIRSFSQIKRYHHAGGLRQSERTFFSTKVVLTQQEALTTRHHGRMRVDENYIFEVNQKRIKQFQQEEIKNYTNTYQANPNWQQKTNEYYQRTSARRDPRNTSVPERYDNFEYYTKTKFYQNQAYTTLHRRKIGRIQGKSEQQEVLDIMKYRQFRVYQNTLTLESINLNSQHTMIAFGVDLLNNQTLTWNLKKINPNKDSQNVSARQSSFDLLFKWNDNSGIDQVNFHGDQGIFYVKYKNMIPKILCYKRINKNTLEVDQKQLVIYQEKSNFHINIQSSKDKKYLIITAVSHSSSKVMALSINKFQQLLQANKNIKAYKFPAKNIIEIKQQSNQKHLIAHSGDDFIFIKTNQQGSVVALVKQQQVQQARQNIKTLTNKQIPIHKTLPEQRITEIDVFKGKLVLYIKKVTKPIIRIVDIATSESRDINLPYQVGIIQPAANKFYQTNQFVFTLNTPFVYSQTYKYLFDTNKVELVQKFELIGSKFKSENFQVKTLDVPSQTGDLIPLTIINKKQGLSKYLKTNERKKCLIHVYGHYGIEMEVNFVNHYLTALQNDWIIAFAHVRGGNQKGRKWHLSVKQKANRNRSWKDLTQCVGFLLKQEYTHPSILFLHCHSAGSITAWNAVNMYPHLYKGVVMLYPFLDVLGSLLKQDDPLSSSDHQQFGNPLLSRSAYNNIQSFSPYENIQIRQQYPLIYLIAGQNDYRCPMWQIAKFVKRFRTRTQYAQNHKLNQQFKKTLPSQSNILVRVDTASSHFGNANLQEQTARNCQMMAFLQYISEQGSKDCTFQ